jgi:hypothetical protein
VEGWDSLDFVGVDEYWFFVVCMYVIVIFNRGVWCMMVLVKGGVMLGVVGLGVGFCMVFGLGVFDGVVGGVWCRVVLWGGGVVVSLGYVWVG